MRLHTQFFLLFAATAAAAFVVVSSMPVRRYTFFPIIFSFFCFSCLFVIFVPAYFHMLCMCFEALEHTYTLKAANHVEWMCHSIHLTFESKFQSFMTKKTVRENVCLVLCVCVCMCLCLCIWACIAARMKNDIKLNECMIFYHLEGEKARN